MSGLATAPLSLVNLVKRVAEAYFKIFPHIWWLVLISAAIHLVVPWFFVWNNTLGWVVLVGFVLLMWFFYTAILCTANVTLQGGQIKMVTAFRLAKQRFLKVLGSNIIFFAIGLLLLLTEYALNLMFDLVHQHPMFVGVTIALDMYVFIMLYFAIPLIALDDFSVLAAFERSVRLVKNNWWRTFILLVIVAGFILGCEALGILFTGQHRLFLFTGYHFFIQVISYPLLIAVTLIVLNDLKLRYSERNSLV